jgi:ATP-binding cassette subfamily B protein
VRRRVFALLRPQLRLIALAGAAIVLTTAITISGPALVKYAIDNGLRRHDRAALDRAALLYVALVLARPVLERMLVLFSARAGERFLGDVRTAAFDRLQQLSLSFFEGERAGVLVSRLTADVQSLTTFVRQVLVEVVGSLLLLIVALVVLVVLSPLLAAATLVAAPILILSFSFYKHRSPRAYLALRDRVADTLTSLQEGLAGMRVVQSFSREEDQRSGYERRSAAQIGAWRRASLVNMTLFPVISLAQAAATAAVLIAGGILVHGGSVSIGTVAAFVLYLTSLFDPIARLADWYSEFQSGRAALTKIVGLLETPVVVREPAAPRPLPGRAALVAEKVWFSYESGRPALRGITLAIEPGERLALVGATGAGKSTLAKLLAREYDPDKGRIAFGGVDLQETSVAALRRRIVHLPQEGHLFSGSIADNVRLARPEASDEDVAAALRRIGALERFRALPAGLDTDVQTRGVRLSSGERQLVGLARVALVEPAVLILDEATSSLDPGTEAAVERALAAISAGRTVITVAHRLSTAERADRVALIERGELAGLGSHDELLAESESYAELWLSWQLGVGAAAA